MKICICCINVGNKYTNKDVDDLFSSVQKNTTFDCNYRVFDEPILDRWWNKVTYFSPLIEPFSEDLVVAFDIDVLIKSNIDEMIEWGLQQNYLSAVWCRWRLHHHDYEHLRKILEVITPYNSSILIWKPNTSNIVWEKFDISFQDKYGGFDSYLWMEHLDPIKIPAKFYYSAFFDAYEDLNFPVCLFNNIDDKKSITNLCPWIWNYK